jgi:hypothetical protein
MASSDRPEVKWHPARLISAYGIKGETEQEQRAVSALLAVMVAVPDFGRDLLSRLGAPGGKLSAYTEVRFDGGEEGKSLRPDGALVVERGHTRWSCLIEVKTGGNPLIRSQVEDYLGLARTHGFNAVLTISNDIVADASELPISVDKRSVKGLTVRHLSWWRILTSAIEQKEHHGIVDPEQAWILGQLIQYLQDDRSGASGFAGMGDHWVRVRDGARDMTLRPTDAAVLEVAQRWEQYIEYLSLELRQTLGRQVAPVWARKTDRATRVVGAARTLAGDGVLVASIRVPDAAAAIDLEANLRTRQFTTSVDIDAPKDGRALTRINWLLRQAREMPARLRVEVRYPNVREPVAVLLGDAIAKPERLLYAPDPKREPRSFRLALAGELGRKRDTGPGSFIGDSRQQLHGFYRDVLQGIRAWQPPAPRLPVPGKPAEAVPLDDEIPEPFVPDADAPAATD